MNYKIFNVNYKVLLHFLSKMMILTQNTQNVMLSHAENELATLAHFTPQEVRVLLYLIYKFENVSFISCWDQITNHPQNINI